MTFYIPPFWCGVIATVAFEFCMVIGSVVISTHGKDKKKGVEEVEEEINGTVGTYNDCGEWNDSQCGGN